MTTDLSKRWLCDTKDKIIYFNPERKRFLHFFSWFRKRDKVKELYKYIQEIFSEENYMAAQTPLKTDGLRKPDSMYTMFQLTNGWVINQNDLKYLKNGPLITEDGKYVLVQEKFYYYQEFLGKLLESIIAIMLGIWSSILYDELFK